MANKTPRSNLMAADESLMQASNSTPTPRFRPAPRALPSSVRVRISTITKKRPSRNYYSPRVQESCRPHRGRAAAATHYKCRRTGPGSSQHGEQLPAEGQFRTPMICALLALYPLSSNILLPSSIRVSWRPKAAAAAWWRSE
jgi:hypothetical protein